MSVSIEYAQEHLAELIANLSPGDELHIHQSGQPIARLLRDKAVVQPRKAGSAAHLPHWMAPDFDAPLEEFKEYME